MSSYISALELKSTSKKKAFIINSTKTFWFFSEFFCSISSSHFQSSNFMSAFNRKPNRIWKNSKKLERNALSTIGKAFKKKRK